MPKPKPASQMTQEEINDFCRATSAVYFSILRFYALRTGKPAMIPSMLCPKDFAPCTHAYDEETLDEAEQFLLRMGFIDERP